MKKDNKTRQIAILERILSYAEFREKHLSELQVLAEKLKKLKEENSENYYHKMKTRMKCPECNATEIYRIGRLVIPEPGGKETVYIDYSKAHGPEPGMYECVNGHQFTIEAR